MRILPERRPMEDEGLLNVTSNRRRTSNGVHHSIANLDVRFRTDDGGDEG